MTVTGHARGFVLKGGLLLGAYDVRRPTKDVDSNAVRACVSGEWLTQVARDVAGADGADGVAFDLRPRVARGAAATPRPAVRCRGRRRSARLTSSLKLRPSDSAPLSAA